MIVLVLIYQCRIENINSLTGITEKNITELLSFGIKIEVP